jgi:hypothetical protein
MAFTVEFNMMMRGGLRRLIAFRHNRLDHAVEPTQEIFLGINRADGSPIIGDLGELRT